MSFKMIFFLLFFNLLFVVPFYGQELISKEDFKIYDEGKEILEIGDLVGVFDFIKYPYLMREDFESAWKYFENSIVYDFGIIFTLKKNSENKCFDYNRIVKVTTNSNRFSYPRGIKIGDDFLSVKSEFVETPTVENDKLIFSYENKMGEVGKISYFFKNGLLDEIEWSLEDEEALALAIRKPCESDSGSGNSEK